MVMANNHTILAEIASVWPAAECRNVLLTISDSSFDCRTRSHFYLASLYFYPRALATSTNNICMSHQPFHHCGIIIKAAVKILFISLSKRCRLQNVPQSKAGNRCQTKATSRSHSRTHEYPTQHPHPHPHPDSHLHLHAEL